MDTCSICKITGIENVEVISCQCETKFHKNHLAAWVATQNFCPICRSEFTNDFVDNLLREVTPHNFDEELIDSFRKD